MTTHRDRRTTRLALFSTLALGALLSGCGGGGGTIAMDEPGSPFIAFNIWVKAGSQNDPQGKEGLASLTAQLLADGSTQQDSYQQILEKLYPMAAGYGASVDKEMTNFRGTVHVDNLEGYYTLLKNALLAPAFSQADFDRIKSQTLNYLERQRRYNRDEELSKELLYWMAYEGTPYQHPVEGYVQSVKSITLDDVKAFYQKHYLRNNIVTAVGGGFPEGFVQRVRADFDALPKGDVEEVPAPVVTKPDRVRILIVEKETEATAISMGFPTELIRGKGDFYAMKLVNAWFGDHRNSFSHLYQVIREKRGMNYGDYSYIEPFPRGYATQDRPVNVSRRSNLFEIWIRPIGQTWSGDLHDRALFATRAALRELARLTGNSLPQAEIDRTKTFLSDYSLNYGSTVSRRLAYAVDDAFYGLSGPSGYLAAIRPELAKVTKKDVDAAIKENLVSPGIYIVFITRDGQALKRLIESAKPTPNTYSGRVLLSLVSEDQQIAAWPITVQGDDIKVMDISEVFESR